MPVISGWDIELHHEGLNQWTVMPYWNDLLQGQFVDHFDNLVEALDYIKEIQEIQEIRAIKLK